MKNLAAWKAPAILVIAGANLTVLQYVALKEFASLVGSNEVVALLVMVAYFLGLSLGYLLSDRLGRRAMLAWCVGTLLLHASLPFSARYVAGAFHAINLAGNIPPFVLALVLFGITPFYALLLPRLVEQAGKESSLGLPHLYAAELSGGLLGLLLVAAVSPARMDWLLTIYLAGLVAIMWLAAERVRLPLALLAIIPAIYASHFGAWDKASLAYYYRQAQGHDDPVVLASEFSPYQRVDLVQEGTAEGARRYLYLNGNLNYGTQRLNEHNLFVSVLPTLLSRHAHPKALVIGGGSLDSARFLAPRTRSLQVVELDETVVRLTRKFIQARHGGMPPNCTLTSADGKQFVARYGGEPLDVLAIDVPVPASLQTAMLHSERFFKSAASKLAPDGIFAISLSGSYRYVPPGSDGLLTSQLANRIVAGLYRAFPHVWVVENGSWSYALASKTDLGLSEGLIRKRLGEFLASNSAADFFGKPDARLATERDCRARAEGFRPLGDPDMQIVLQVSLRKLYHRYYHAQR